MKRSMNAIRLALMLIAITSLTVLAVEVSVGDKAPEFSAMDQDGKVWSLKEHLDGKHLVLYFYPAAMTGGCTKQACGYRDYYMGNAHPDFQVVAQ